MIFGTVGFDFKAEIPSMRVGFHSVRTMTSDGDDAAENIKIMVTKSRRTALKSA
jgi:hypothetical protein